MGDMELTVDLAVIGAGPGGCGAAFRAADLGLDVALIESTPYLGGSCFHDDSLRPETMLELRQSLKALHNLADVILPAAKPHLDIGLIRRFKERTERPLTAHMLELCRKRGIELIQGSAAFVAHNRLRISGSSVSAVRFSDCVIATGTEQLPPHQALSSATPLFTSTDAPLGAGTVPDKILLVGIGAKALELATFYGGVGCNTTLIVPDGELLPEADADLAEIAFKQLCNSPVNLLVGSVTGFSNSQDHLDATILLNDGEIHGTFGQVIYSSETKAATAPLDLEQAGLTAGAHGILAVDDQQRTAVSRIYAVGAVTAVQCPPHVALRQGRIAAESISGRATGFDAVANPTLVYGDPVLSWCGLTEKEAKNGKIGHRVERFTSPASETSMQTFTKLITDPEDGRLLGAGFAGKNASLLVSEAVLALEMGCMVEDLALILHPYLTASTTIGETAERLGKNPTFSIL